jgi:hypothetical protein
MQRQRFMKITQMVLKLPPIWNNHEVDKAKNFEYQPLMMFMPYLMIQFQIQSLRFLVLLKDLANNSMQEHKIFFEIVRRLF